MTINLFSKRLEHLPASIWNRIAQIDEYKGRWTASARLHPQVLGRLKRSVLVTSTGASTRIEGAKLSDRDIEKMLRGLSIRQFSDRDVQEVQGYYELLTNVFNTWRSLRFCESLVKHFHQEFLKYVEKDERHRGQYKKQENKVHMVDEVAPRTLSEKLDIPRSTISQLLNKLMDLGKIERIGMGRATRYRVITFD